MKLKTTISAVTLALFSTIAFATPSEINIAYVKSPFNLQNMVMKQNKMLEKEFEKDGIKINWHDINSGAKQTQAMAAGSLDVSATMNTASLLMANASGNSVVIASGVAHPTKIFALVGKPGPQIKIEDLKGKTVVGPKGTVLHQMLVAALASKGLDAKDVNFISMDIPKGMTAMMAGQVDAALLAAGGVIKANNGGAKTITTADGLLKPNLVLTASKKFADENPKLLQRIVDVNRAALKWIDANPEKALEIGAKEQGISLSDAKLLKDWSKYYNTLDKSDIQGLSDDQDFLIKNGMMDKKVDVNSLVLPMALK